MSETSKPETGGVNRRDLFAAAGGGIAAAVLGAPAAAAQTVPSAAPPSGEYIIENVAILSMDDTVGILDRGAIHVKDGKIAAIAAGIELPGVARVDGAGRIAMPGMADTHWHMWNTLFKNMLTPKRPYFPMKLALGPHHTPNDYYIATRLALAEALDAGITGVLNYAHAIRSPDHADAEIRAMQESGLRGLYAYSGADPTPYDQIIDHADIRRISAQYFPGGRDAAGRIGLAIGERAPGAAVENDRRDEDYRQAFDLGIPLILHAGTSPVRHRLPSIMQAKGLLNQDTLFVHGLMMTEADRRILLETGASVSLPLGTDYTTGRGEQVRAMMVNLLHAGGNVSLSCDATSLTPTSIFEHMRMAWYLASPQVGSDYENVPGPTPLQILAMGTRNGLKAMGFGAVSGTLTPGKQADIVLLNARSLNMAPVGDQIDKAVLHSAMTHNVETVIVDGAVLKWQGKVISVDVEQIRQEAIEALHNLRKKAGGDLAPASDTLPLF